jgi:Tfp pilus assembly protein PilF
MGANTLYVPLRQQRRSPRKSAAGSSSFLGSGRARGSGTWLLSCVAIVGLTFAAYLPSLTNGFTNWDDPLFVLRNRLLLNPISIAVLTTPVVSNYHPLTIWSLALNYRLSGLNANSYHWLNLILHLASTALVFVFIRRLTRDRFWTTAATSLFFGIHPMHVESVAWIAERKDVLYVVFYLLALIIYLRYLERQKAAWLGATLLAFLLSVASKPSAVVLPLTLLAIDFYRRRPLRARVFLEKAPFLAISLAAGVLTVHAQKITGAIDTGTWGPSFRKLLYVSYGIVMYVVKLFVPVRLSAIYPYPRAAEPLGLQYYAALALVVVGLPAIVYLCRRNRAVLFGLAFFFINIALVSQVFTVGRAIMADRYTYLPYVGLVFAVAWWLDEDPAHRSAGRVFKSLLAGSMILLAPFCLIQTWTRCSVWRNSETLWNDTIRRYPHRIAEAYYNRGHYYFEDERRFDVALADFDESLTIDPRKSEAWLSKGNLMAARNQSDSALVCFDRALKIKPDLDAAWNNRSVVRSRIGDPQGALADVDRAIAINPRYRDAYCNRALVYAGMKEYEKSIVASRRAIELDPNHPDNHLQYASIGVALEQLKRYADAITALDEAIRLSLHGDMKTGNYFLLRSYAKLELGDRVGARSDALDAVRFGATVDPAYLRLFGG